MEDKNRIKLFLYVAIAFLGFAVILLPILAVYATARDYGNAIVALQDSLHLYAKTYVELLKERQLYRENERKFVYHLEGIVSSVEIKTKEIPDVTEANSRLSKVFKFAKEEFKTNFDFTFPNEKVPSFVIHFSDGRFKEFIGVPPIELLEGKRYHFQFNGLDEILDIVDIK